MFIDELDNLELAILGLPVLDDATTLESDTEPRMENHEGLDHFYTQYAELDEYLDDEVLFPEDKTKIRIGHWNINDVCDFLRDGKLQTAFHPAVVEEEPGCFYLVF